MVPLKPFGPTGWMSGARLVLRLDWAPLCLNLALHYLWLASVLSALLDWALCCLSPVPVCLDWAACHLDLDLYIVSIMQGHTVQLTWLHLGLEIWWQGSEN